MALLPHLARAEFAGVCLDLAKLSDISSVVRQRKERLAEDLEMQTSVRHAVVAAARNAAWRSRVEAEEDGDCDLINVAKKEDAVIAQIQSEVELLYRLRRTW